MVGGRVGCQLVCRSAGHVCSKSIKQMRVHERSAPFINIARKERPNISQSIYKILNGIRNELLNEHLRLGFREKLCGHTLE